MELLVLMCITFFESTHTSSQRTVWLTLHSSGNLTEICKCGWKSRQHNSRHLNKCTHCKTLAEQFTVSSAGGGVARIFQLLKARPGWLGSWEASSRLISVAMETRHGKGADKHRGAVPWKCGRQVWQFVWIQLSMEHSNDVSFKSQSQLFNVIFNVHLNSFLCTQYILIYDIWSHF